jgi:hypothetical protein
VDTSCANLGHRTNEAPHRIQGFCFASAIASKTHTAARKKAGFSQEKLPEKADLCTVFVSRIERGVESPSLDNLEKESVNEIVMFSPSPLLPPG